MFKKLLLLAALISFSLFPVKGGNKDFDEPMRELRAVWLTSAWNIDWPHSTSASATNQKIRLRNMLNTLQDANINAVLFQVRPHADALYQSAYEPWSQWITGTRGQDPGYDPLEFVIKEANIRGMEVHAWLNPYRFENNAGEYSGMPGDYAVSHPELIFVHNNRTYFDPGRPGTTQLIKKIIADLVENYDLDGIVFDDYFYPSGMPLSADQETWDTYATQEFVLQYYSTFTRGNFRRASVNNMIKEVNDTIKAINPNMVFGVSPAGIYSTSAAAANNWGTTLPAGITGADNYNTIFCDPLAWLHDGSVDYISPQLYWQIGGNQDFVTLTQWWGYQAGRHNLHSYPSLGSYRLYSQKEEFYKEKQNGILNFILQFFRRKDTGPEKSGWPVSQIGDQIIANRNNPDNLADGLIFYNTSSFVSPTKDLAGYLAQDLFAAKAVFPYLEWLPGLEPGAPQITEIGTAGDYPDAAAMSVTNTQATRHLLYGWEDMPSAKNRKNPEHMQIIFGEDLALFRPKEYNYFQVAEFLPNKEIGNVSEPTHYEEFDTVVIINPDGDTVCDLFEFTWTGHESAEAYQLLIATKQHPASMIYESPLMSENSYRLPSGLLPGQRNYVARVRSTSDDLVSFSAQAVFFTGYPIETRVNSPANGAENVSLQTTAQWNSIAGVSHYHLQVATDESFTELVADLEPLSSNITSLSLESPGTQHHIRVRAANNCGYGYWSPVNSFTTTEETFVVSHESSFLQAYPNPTGDFFRVDYPQTLQQRTISIYNHKGQLISTINKNDETGSDKIELSSLPAGLYVVNVKASGQGQFTVKVVKSN